MPDEQTNEISTVPLLPESADISGCIVTADATSCQREIAKKIISGKGDCVLNLKKNHPMLCQYAETCPKDALEHPQQYPEMTTCETVDKRHGRIAKNLLYVTVLILIGEF